MEKVIFCKSNCVNIWLPEISFVYLPCCNNEVTTLNKGYENRINKVVDRAKKAR